MLVFFRPDLARPSADTGFKRSKRDDHSEQSARHDDGQQANQQFLIKRHFPRLVHAAVLVLQPTATRAGRVTPDFFCHG